MHSHTIVASLAALLCAVPLTAQAPNAHPGPSTTPREVQTVAPREVRTGPSNARPGTVVRQGVRLPRTPDGAGANILIYDNNSNNQLAQQAATTIGGTVVVATAFDFNTQLTSGTWDVVGVDCPSSIPSGGWTDLINYVNGGGAAVLSFWDWDNDAGQGDPALPGAFDVSVAQSIMLPGQTLFDSGTSTVFAGVTMPNSDWSDNWLDDGDEFNPGAGATGLGHLGTPATPTMVLGNGGSTIASMVIDEAGATWLGDGSGVRLWENMLNLVMAGPPSLNILVYDNDSINNLGQQAAINIDPGAVVGTSADFNTLLTSQSWDVVVVDCPNFNPATGWGDLINYVNGGGAAVMSFWDWDNDSGFGDPNLPPAFGVWVSQSFSLMGHTLRDLNTTNLFNGVTMPNGEWANNWLDDGDEFGLVDTARGAGALGRPTGPVRDGWLPCVSIGNGGRTIASFVIDEAGPTWLGDGSGVQLWENMITSALTNSARASKPRRDGDR